MEIIHKNRFIYLGLLAQLVEHRVHIAGVIGSSPIQTTIKPLQVEMLAGFFILEKEVVL